MAFPQTRHSMIDRMVHANSQGDWSYFLRAYWAPMCAFAKRRGRLNDTEAEDIVGVVVESLVQNQLLDKWHSDHSAKLRTYLCAIITYAINNRARVESGRQKLHNKWDHELTSAGSSGLLAQNTPDQEDLDMLYAGWVSQVLKAVFTDLHVDLKKSGKTSYLQVLYGKISLKLSNKALAEKLELKATDVDNHYRTIRKSLRKQMRSTLHKHVAPGQSEEHLDSEIVQEWQHLSTYLKTHGGLDTTLDNLYPGLMGLQDPLLAK